MSFLHISAGITNLIHSLETRQKEKGRTNLIHNKDVIEKRQYFDDNSLFQLPSLLYCHHELKDK
jgi:hypothetical protein